MKKLIWKAVLTWFLFVPIAIANGIIRELTYRSWVGDLTGHQISTITAIAAYLILVFLILRKEIKAATIRQLFLVGFLMTIMTVIFEFGFGHYVDKISWEGLLADYNILKGHIWPVFLITEIFTPWLIKIKISKER